MSKYMTIVDTIRTHYPNVQACLPVRVRPHRATMAGQRRVILRSLLPADEAKRAVNLAMSDLRAALERLLGTEVDLINLRQVSTVFQKEIIMAERRIFLAHLNAAGTGLKCWSSQYYQKLNEERGEILALFQRHGKGLRRMNDIVVNKIQSIQCAASSAARGGIRRQSRRF